MKYCLFLFFISFQITGKCQSIGHPILNIKRIDSLFINTEEYKKLFESCKNTPDKIGSYIVSDENDTVIIQAGFFLQGLACGFVRVYDIYYSIKKDTIIGSKEIKE